MIWHGELRLHWAASEDDPIGVPVNEDAKPATVTVTLDSARHEATLDFDEEVKEWHAIPTAANRIVLFVDGEAMWWYRLETIALPGQNVTFTTTQGWFT